MVIAIIAALVAAVVLTIIIVVVFVVRSRSKASYAGQKLEVRSIDSVGVASSLPAKNETSDAQDKVSSSSYSSQKKPADNLKTRFLALGVFAAAIFGTLEAKLWSIQVMAYDSYANEAAKNLYSTVPTPAPRGYICDMSGIPLVKNRICLTVLADPDVADDHDTVLRLSAVLGVPANVVRQRIQDTSSGAQSQRVVASDVRMRDIAFITEHADAFPGIIVDPRTVRDYPYGALAAHVLGYTGTISEEELEGVADGRNVVASDDVGKSGVEAMYDNLLAGDHGQRVVVVDAKGNILEIASETQPVKGSDIYLTLSGPVQYACDKALATLIAPEAGAIGSGKGVAGAIVAMDVRDGGILAMASYPTYAPATFIGGIPQDTWDLYRTETSHYPLMNRAISGEYPAASTYKAFTGMAGLEYGFADTKKTWTCTGSWDGFESGDWQDCWLDGGHGSLNFREGIVNSCDTVFYEIAKDFFFAGVSQGGSLSDTAMQEEIAKYHFGQTTGIDLGSEVAGRIPTPEWKAEHWRNVPSEGVWKGGDLTNMVIGQGDVLITPIQLAVAYGAIATGNIVKPHLLKEVRNAQGDVVVSFEPEVVDQPAVTAEHLATIRDALHGVATDNAGLARMFEAYGIDAAAKTGTAENIDKEDTSWFVCYAPYDDPKYVVACIVEQGGGGSETAAPLGVDVMAAALAADAGTLEPIMGYIAGSTGKEVKRTVTAEKSGRMD